MQDLIEQYIDNTYSDEMATEIYRSLSLFTALEYDTPFHKLYETIMSEGTVDSSGLMDIFSRRLNEALDTALQQYKIKLIDWATLEEKNEVLSALVFVLHVEDYTGIIRTLETMEPDEVQLAEVISEFSIYDVTKVMELLEEVNPSTLQALKDYIYQKEKAEELQTYAEPKIVRHMKFFNEVFGKDNLAYHMVNGQMLTGQPFETYLTYVIQTYNPEADLKKTALDLLSVLFISSDGFNAPLLVYRKNSHKLIDDLTVITRVEVELLNHIAKLSEYKKVADEKARLHQTVVVI